MGGIKSLCIIIHCSIEDRVVMLECAFCPGLKAVYVSANISIFALNAAQAVPGLWSLAHTVIPSISSKLAQFRQNRWSDLFGLTSAFLGLNSWQQTDGPWCMAHRATPSLSLRSSRFAQSLQLFMCISKLPGVQGE